MRNLRVTLLVLPLATIQSSWSSDVAEQAQNRKVFAAIARSIVGIEAGTESFSGVVVSASGLIVTDASAAQAGTPVVQKLNGERIAARVIAADAKLGLVLLQAPDAGEPVQFAGSGVRVGDRVYSAANPFESVQDQQVSFSAGTVSSVELGSDFSPSTFETDVAINPGSEGGAVVDDNGCLIGIITGKLNLSRNTGLCIQINRVVHAFADSLSPRPEPRARSEQQPTQSASVVRVVTGSSERTGVVIEVQGLIATAEEGLNAPVSIECNGRTYPARVLSRDEGLDVALLKVDASFVSAMPLFTGGDYAEGHRVRVFGRECCNCGIISASKRFCGTACQIDAKVNAGNYGGPVVDAAGRLIGIVTHYSPDHDYSQPNCGVGFFTPARKIAAYFAPVLLGFPKTCDDHTASKTSAAEEALCESIAEAKRRTVIISTGAGVVVSPDGYILTCYHVACSAETWPVSLEGKTYTADVVDRDAESDLCLLKIRNTLNLPYAELAESDSLQVGDTVLSAGDPFKLAGTDAVPAFSVGIVSALHRNQGRCHDVIQTDAAVNPGSSGGPQFDIHGKLIGINGHIRYRFAAVANTGIGFGIPSAKALKWIVHHQPVLLATK